MEGWGEIYLFKILFVVHYKQQGGEGAKRTCSLEIVFNSFKILKLKYCGKSDGNVDVAGEVSRKGNCG